MDVFSTHPWPRKTHTPLFRSGKRGVGWAGVGDGPRYAGGSEGRPQDARGGAAAVAGGPRPAGPRGGGRGRHARRRRRRLADRGLAPGVRGPASPATTGATVPRTTRFGSRDGTRDAAKTRKPRRDPAAPRRVVRAGARRPRSLRHRRRRVASAFRPRRRFRAPCSGRAGVRRTGTRVSEPASGGPRPLAHGYRRPPLLAPDSRTLSLSGFSPLLRCPATSPIPPRRARPGSRPRGRASVEGASRERRRLYAGPATLRWRFAASKLGRVLHARA